MPSADSVSRLAKDRLTDACVNTSGAARSMEALSISQTDVCRPPSSAGARTLTRTVCLPARGCFSDCPPPISWWARWWRHFFSPNIFSPIRKHQPEAMLDQVLVLQGRIWLTQSYQVEDVFLTAGQGWQNQAQGRCSLHAETVSVLRVTYRCQPTLSQRLLNRIGLLQ